MNAERQTVNREQPVRVSNGWLMLPLNLALVLGGPALLIYSIVSGVDRYNHPVWSLFILALLMLMAGFLMLFGFFALQPNEARVLILFGEYRGTVRESGFHWGNPFYSNGRGNSGAIALAAAGKSAEAGAAVAAMKKHSRNKISLRARNLNGERLKVNDKRGNPIEIAAVVVWRVKDTAQAMFDVDDYEEYVRIQSESAVRHLASQYAYDHGEDNEVTLRSGFDEISQALTVELQELAFRSKK